MGWLLLSLFLVNPQPLDMPRAESYLVRDNGRYRLEDRYSTMDLWFSRTSLGIWTDDDGRVFSLARLECKLPPADSVVSRVTYGKRVRPIGRRDNYARQRVMAELVPIPLAENGERPRQKCRGYREILYWQGTNTSHIVCEFRPENTETHYLAVWRLAEDDDQGEMLKLFENEFLAKEFKTVADFPTWSEFQKLSEPEALRTDAHDSVTNFAAWHWTDVDDYTVLDDLHGSRELVDSITNLLPQLKADFVRALPTALDGTNVLGVVRVFNSRAEYLNAVDESMGWTAAYWSPRRREIVAYLPQAGLDSLLRTFRHEAFHQYLSYATAMIPTSPWLNEGYAQYFEDPKNVRLPWSKLQLDEIEPVLSSVFDMDYEEFYAGDDAERLLKYQLAWSVAVFMEKGLREIRNDPFEHFKRDYLTTLVSTQDMRKATDAAFKNADRRDLFVSEWKRFWKNTSAD